MEQNRCAGGIAPVVTCEFRRHDPLNILQENKGRSANSDTSQDVWEEMSWVGVGSPRAGMAKWLAGKTPRNQTDALKLLPRKCAKIIPDRSRRKEPAFHFRNSIFHCKGFDLANSGES
jgi:hypothetical protein